MKDQDKTKAQLIQESEELRRRIANLGFNDDVLCDS
jgi:hypothetical protein